MNFENLNLSKEMLETLQEIGYQKPSKVQSGVIPYALEGKDIIGQAHTGTGKTAAFAIPIIEKAIINKTLQSIILAPSRELAVQIFNEMKKLSARKGLRIIEIIGGISYTKQERDLRNKPNIIVATPGRFLDHLDKGRIDTSSVTSFTLDEADEMLNFGFLKDIKKISASLPKKIQTYFLTATFNKKINLLAKELLSNPVSITISEGLSTTEKVAQKYILLKEKQKLRTLASLLQISKPKATIIFGRTRRRVEELAGALAKLGFKVRGIQGDMRQRERSIVMDLFRSGQIDILVGTDVMARGIDVDHVDFVFNFDLPTEIEYYTHRIGRTGRAGKTGVAVSFVKETELGYFKQVMRLTQSKVEEWPIPSDKDLSEIKDADLKVKIEKLLARGLERHHQLGIKISEQYTKEELGVIIASQLVRQTVSAYDITLTGESSVNNKKSNNRGYSRGNKNQKYSRSASSKNKGSRFNNPKRNYK